MGLVNTVEQRVRGLVDRVLVNRRRLPGFVNRLIDYIADNPDSAMGRLAARSLGSYGPEDIPAPTVAPKAARTVYIGPTNYASQGYLWARSIDSAPEDVLAKNMAVDVPGGFSFPADTEVSIPVFNSSSEWQQAQFEAVAHYSHALFEAERALFGRLYSRDITREAQALASRGVSTAFISHGVDIRLPSRHLTLTPWSPYGDDEFYVAKFEREAARNRAILDALGRPVFVSTPDLLADVPYGIWCPVVIDPNRWVGASPVGERAVPVVAHVPSKSAIKGTHLIEPALRELQQQGAIEYRTITGIPAAQMPEIYGSADVVLDQFRLGSYGVAACEAMAAGRVVLGHVTKAVRQTVKDETGLSLPIVEATPLTIKDVLLELFADTERMRALSAEGVEFVSEVHDGRRSARALLDSWVLKGRDD